MTAAARKSWAYNPARHQALDEAMELLQAASRNLEGSSRMILAKRGIGRAHQRIIHLISRIPGQSISDMLARLHVTKQALNTPLNDLKRKGLVRTRRQPGNGRRKQLFLTPSGLALEEALSEEQRDRLAAAFRKVGHQGERGWRRTMQRLADGDRLFAAMRHLGGSPPVRRMLARRRLGHLSR
jgi:DNA-binding MarR family transcriptional regulator